MILAVRLEMILELQNALAQDRNLNFWRTGIGLVNTVCCDYLLLASAASAMLEKILLVLT